MSLVDRYRTWLEFEIDAHARTLSALDTVAETGCGESHQQALDLFAHMMAARRLWLHRLGAVDSGPESLQELFPSGVARERLDDLLATTSADWRTYLERLNHQELGRELEYTATGGERFANSVEEILTQLFGHAWHHRGQIMSLIRQSGGQPVDCGFVFWTRRTPAGEPGPAES